MPLDDAPLKGLRIAVTRERARAKEMADLFSGHGAEPLVCPMITFLPPESWKQADDAIAKLQTFTWIVFTSINGVAYFCNRVKELGQKLTDLKGRRIACVGEATAAELRKFGLTSDYIPEQQSSEELLAALSRMVKLAGLKILLPRGDMASPLLREGLRKQGAQVTDPIVYRNVPDDDGVRILREALTAGMLDVVCFSSPSAAVNAVKGLASAAKELLGKVRVYSIGPMTSRGIKDAGIDLTAEAAQHDMPGLVDLVLRAEGSRGGK